MAKSGDVTHILAELSSMKSLISVLGNSSRLKFTCLSVCRQYLALGSNSGGVYVFSRETLKYLQVVFGDNVATPVTSVCLSPGDQHIGIALSTGLVVVYGLNIEKRQKPERIRQTHDHVGHNVTALIWDSLSSKLFIGDDKGKISIAFVPSTKTKTLFALPSEVILYLEQSVYQLDWWRDKLLVSTVTHSYLLDTIKHNYATIGTKKRDGEFGSCVFMEPKSQCPVIYCARPGYRIWEVNFEGNVLNTHQFKHLLAVPPVPVPRLEQDTFDTQLCEVTQGQASNFAKMLRIGQYIVTWSSRGLYLLDPINVKLVVWTQSILGIKDMVTFNNDVYLFLENSTVCRLVFLPIYQLFTILAKRSQWSLMSSILFVAEQVNMRTAIIKRVKQDLLQALLNGLREEGKTSMADKVKAVMEDFSEGSVDSLALSDYFMDTAEVMGHTYLPSGMIVVSEGIPVMEGVGSDRTGNSPKKSMSTADFDDEDTWSRVGQEVMTLYQQNETSVAVDITREDNLSPRRERLETQSVCSDSENESCSSSYNGDKMNVGLKNDNEKLLNSSSVACEDDVFRQSSALLEPSDVTDVQMDSSTCVLEKVQDHSVGRDSNNLDKESHIILDNLTSFSKYSATAHLHVSGAEHIDDESLNTTQSFISGAENIQSGETSVSNQQSNCVRVDNCKTENKKDILVSSEESNSLEISSELTLCSSESECLRDVSLGSKDTSENDSTKVLGSISSEGNVLHSCTVHSKVTSLDNGYEKCSGSQVQGRTGERLVDMHSASNRPLSPKSSSSSATTTATSAVNNGDHVQGSKKTQPTEPLDIADRLAQHSKTNLFSNFEDGDAFEIAQPQKLSKKKKKRRSVGGSEALARSVSTDQKVSKEKGIRYSASVGDFAEEHLYQQVDKDPDTISMETISSIEEGGNSQSAVTPDRVSSPSELSHKGHSVVFPSSPEQGYLKNSPDFRQLPESQYRFPNDSRALLPSPTSDGAIEVIPPLIDRLVAARSSGSVEDIHVSWRDNSPTESPLTASGEYGIMALSSRSSLSTLDGLSSKLKSQTKSLVKKFKEKNPLNPTKTAISMSKSTSSPLLANLISAQDQSELISGMHTEEKRFVEEQDAEQQWSLEREASACVNWQELHYTGLQLLKRLRESSSLLNLNLFRETLDEWAKALNKAMVIYHTEFMKRQTARENLVEREKEKEEYINLEGSCKEETNKRPCSEAVGNNTNDGGNTSEDGSSKNVFSQENGVVEKTRNAVNVTELKENSLLDPKLSCSYWSSIIHSNDPFHLAPEFIEVFQSLTTMCFEARVTGGLLDILNFSNKGHYSSLLYSIYPSSLPASSQRLQAHKLLPLLSSTHLEEELRNLNAAEIAFTANGELQDIAGVSSAGLSGHGVPSTAVKGDMAQISDEEGDLSQSVDISTTVKQDLSRALFTRLFFFLLDYERVKQDLDKLVDDSFFTWTALIHCSQDRGIGNIVSTVLANQQINSAVDYLRSGILPHQSALLGHIFQLFNQAPRKTSELCAELKKFITPLDVIRISVMCSKSASFYLIKYTRQLMVDVPPVLRPATFKDMCKKRDIRGLLLKGMLPSLCPDKSNTAEFESPKSSDASQLTALLQFDWLSVLLDMAKETEEMEEVLKMCTGMKLWSTCVKILKQSGEVKHLISLLFDIDDVHILTSTFENGGVVLNSLDEWRYLLKTFQSKYSQRKKLLDKEVCCEDEFSSVHGHKEKYSEQDSPLQWNSLPSNGNDVPVGPSHSLELDGQRESGHVVLEHCPAEPVNKNSPMENAERNPKSITWDTVASLLLRNLGGVHSIDLIQEFMETNMWQQNLSSEFLTECYADFRIGVEQERMSHEMLEQISMHFWAKQKDFLSPCIAHAVKMEKQMIESNDGEDAFLQTMFNQLSRGSDSVSKYLGGHWGQQIDMSNCCPGCNIALKMPVSLSLPGILVFPCGHAFHKRCVPGAFCPLIHT